jgi:hypothetical protein
MRTTTAAGGGSTAEGVAATSGALVGLGVVTMALFPFAIPIVLLTAASLVPLLPVVVLGGMLFAGALAVRALASLALSRRGR